MTMNNKHEGEDSEKSDSDEGDFRWHVEKKVPLALIVTLFIQTIGMVIWLTNLNNQVQFIGANLETLASRIFTNADGKFLSELLISKNNEQDRRISDLENRIKDYERSNPNRR
jgi:hypothetical protein